MNFLLMLTRECIPVCEMARRFTDSLSKRARMLHPPLAPRMAMRCNQMRDRESDRFQSFVLRRKYVPLCQSASRIRLLARIRCIQTKFRRYRKTESRVVRAKHLGVYLFFLDLSIQLEGKALQNCLAGCQSCCLRT